MELLILDASVVIAFLDASDEHHERATEAIAASRLDEHILPASAYSEILVHAYGAGRAAVAEIERFISEAAIQIRPIDAAIARQAALLRATHSSLRLPDALVLATGDALDGIVLTADRAWAKVSRRVRVV